jgi:two-component system, cell cycle sensor histidine kinase and response regulator CckA
LWDNAIKAKFVAFPMPYTLTPKSENTSREPQGDLRNLLLRQKNELIGELAQAMANQFNNVMMAVIGYTELELKKANRKEKQNLEQLLDKATHATTLIHKLLDFSRKHDSSPQPLELNTVISEIRDLLKQLLSQQIDLVLKLDENSRHIFVDRVDIEQTVLGLAVIARDAMGGEGKLTISTELVDLDQKFIGPQNEAEPGEYVVLSVANSATKNADSASADLDQSLRVNLSFAAVRGIVKDSHGLVRFFSEPGAESSFSLYFPVATAEAAESQDHTLPRNVPVARTILVVEDDEAVRLPAAEFLMMEGFKVLQARTGSEALHVVKQSRSALDMLITDILMPQMNGHEVAAQLLEEHPNLKVLYMSGDPGSSGSAGASRIAKAAILRKPFRLDKLRDKIHDLLGE